MGKANLAVNQLLERKEIFADLLNGALFAGKQYINSDSLELKSVHTGIVQEKETGIETKIEETKKNKQEHCTLGNKNRNGIAAREQFGDIRMEADMGTYSVLWAEETQNKVDYAMPVRTMLYDALEYAKQIKTFEAQHKKNDDSMNDKEFLSGLKKADRLKPVITLVLYCGDDWDGCTSLYDMMQIDPDSEMAEQLKELLPDYRIHLIQPEKIEDMRVFKTNLQHIFSMVKYRSDKESFYNYLQEHREELQRMDYTESLAAYVLLGETKTAEKYLFESGEEEVPDVCKAMDELRKDWKAEGENRLLALINAMLLDHCQNQIQRVVSDAGYRDQMYRKYQL